MNEDPVTAGSTLIFDVMEATWPAAAQIACGPFTLREGQGGGKRVSAATVQDRWSVADLDRAEAEMAKRDLPALFLIRMGDESLDAALAARGYRAIDPVVAYSAPVDRLTVEPAHPMTTFPHWPPMEIDRALWADAGIAAGRLAVMDRVAGAKCVILGRANDRAASVAFIACHGRHAMLHALEVAPRHRRQGSAQNILRAAAIWAQGVGADTLSLAVTVGNDPARALYARLGMDEVGHYHYRQKQNS